MTRMWMVPVECMCDKHLLGEHVESHMIEVNFVKQKSISGYVKNNCIEPLALVKRHNAIAEEMHRRGMRHKSALKHSDIQALVGYLPEHERLATVNTALAKADLVSRCEQCRERMGE